jgi:hypothetical protein
MWRGVILFGILLASCQSFNPIGPAIQIGVYWLQGEAHKYYRADSAVILKALKSSLQELEIPILGEEVRGDTVHLRAGGNGRFGPKGEDRFQIKVRSVKGSTTKVSIRANVFGDKAYCELIYRRMDIKEGIREFESVSQIGRD